MISELQKQKLISLAYAYPTLKVHWSIETCWQVTLRIVQEKHWPNLFFNRKSALGFLASFREATTYIGGKLRLVRLRRTSQ